MSPLIFENAVGFAPVSTILLFSIVSVFFGARINASSSVRVPISTAVILAILVNVAVLLYRVLTDYRLVDDEKVWHRLGVAVSDKLLGNSNIPEGLLAEGKEGYPWIVGIIYAVAGPVPLVPIALNMILLVLLVPIVGKITAVLVEKLNFSQHQREKAVRFSVYFIAITPTVVFWSPRLLRETISMFLIAVSVMCILSLLRKASFGAFVGLAISIALMLFIRAQVGAALGAGLLMGVVLVYSLKLKGLVARAFVVVPIFIVLFVFTWSFANSMGSLSLENAAYRNEALAEANSAFAGAEQLQGASSIADIALFNFPRVLLGPFPNEINFSAVMLLAAISNIFWLLGILLASRIVSRRSMLLDSNPENSKVSQWWAVWLVFTVFITLTVMLAIIAGNYGLVVRMRLMPFVVLVPLASIGVAMPSSRQGSDQVNRGRMKRYEPVVSELRNLRPEAR